MLKLHEKSGDDTVALMADIGRRARAAAGPLAIAATAAKNGALVAMADAIISREQDILDANAIDVSNGHESGLSASSRLSSGVSDHNTDAMEELFHGLCATTSRQLGARPRRSSRRAHSIRPRCGRPSARAARG